MLKVELHNHGAHADPVPCFATATEIEIAEQLRCQLEKRLLVPPVSAPRLPARSSDGSEEAPNPSLCRGREDEQL
jgi:hypothetical protein